MELEIKEQVTKAINEWIDDKNQARSAAKLSEKSGVSTAYISRIKNGEYDMVGGGGRLTHIGDSHFYKIAEAVGLKFDNEFKWDSLNSYKIGYRVLRKAQRKQLRMIIDGDSGQGKTFIQRWYNRENDYVLFVECTRNMTGKALINSICDKLGIDQAQARTPYEKMELIRKVVTNRRGYLLMFDQVGNKEVKPSIYSVLMDIANFIEGRAGMVISGYQVSSMLQKLYDKKAPGYRQLARRFIPNAYELPTITSHEVGQVCELEGITNTGAVNVLKKYVQNIDMLVQWVTDIKEFQERKGGKITGDEVIDLFNINITKLAA
jgi:hypothetical protein